MDDIFSSALSFALNPAGTIADSLFGEETTAGKNTGGGGAGLAFGDLAGGLGDWTSGGGAGLALGDFAGGLGDWTSAGGAGGGLAAEALTSSPGDMFRMG